MSNEGVYKATYVGRLIFSEVAILLRDSYSFASLCDVIPMIKRLKHDVDGFRLALLKLIKGQMPYYTSKIKQAPLFPMIRDF